MRRIPLNGQTFEIPESPSEWELYSKPEAALAAAELTAALSSMLMEVAGKAREGYRLTAQGALLVHRRFMHDVLTRYADVGSNDTEPRSIALYYLDTIAERLAV